jgi:hypothetical protein
VQMFNLSLSSMVKDVGFQIGSMMGIVEEVKTDEDGIGWGKFLRVQIKIDLLRPIPKGKRVKLKGNLEWVSFQYERLPIICLNYKVIKMAVGALLIQNSKVVSHNMVPGYMFLLLLVVPILSKGGWNGG